MIPWHVLSFALMLSSPPASALDWQAPLLQEHPMAGKIIDLQSQQVISEEELLQSLKETPLVMIGEKHDNKDHHQLENRLLNALLDRPIKPAVIFEMLNEQHKEKIATLRSTDSLPTLKTKLEWKKTGWPWQDYGPLFQLTTQLKAPLIAGNIGRERIQAIYKQESDALKDARFDTLPLIEPDVRDTIHQHLYLDHCELMPKERLAPMVDIQLAKDASMASAMLDQRTDSGSILIAGNFHVRKDLSVPLHLEERQSQLATAVVMLAEVKKDKYKPTDYGSFEEADYLWLTPKQNNKDYCEEMRAQMKHHKGVDKS